ncbi:MAG: methyl-accepting chemotaxis protein [Leptospiraceae bacterium]|nr:methyl-accepting chemotaxis protein [Leptospiraceae bacterium]
MKIRTQFLLGYLFVCAIIVVGGVFSAYSMRVVNEAGENAALRNTPQLYALMESKQHLIAAHLELEQSFLQTDNTEMRKLMWSHLDGAELDVKLLLEGGSHGDWNVEGMQDAAIRSEVETLADHLRALRQLTAQRIDQEDNAGLRQEYHVRYTQTMDHLEMLEKSIQQELFAEVNTFRKFHKFGLSFIVGATLLSLALAVLVGLLSARRIAGAIRRVSGRLQDVAAGEGDLTIRLEASDRDELGELAANFNIFAEKIRDIILRIKDMSDNLAVTSEQMASTSENFSNNAQDQAATFEEMTVTAEEVSAGMESVAENTDDQFNTVQGLQDRITELSAVTDKMAGRIRTATGAINEILADARTSQERLQSMVTSMENIQASSAEMNGAVQIINEISDKINLLSLNASIESARAGEAGRGFAVVAEEISRLADQTAGSIREIDDRIKMNDAEIQKGMQETRAVHASMEKVIGGIDSITAVTGDMDRFLSDQLESNDRVKSSMTLLQGKTGLIRTSTREHRDAMSEISRSLSNVNNIAQSVASGAQEIAATSHALSKLAESLKKNVGYFKV